MPYLTNTMATNTAEGKKLHLKYLFTAYFENGDEIAQDQDDTSKIDPERSRFFDVLQLVNAGVKLVYFELNPADPDDKSYHGIDLENGTFNINGATFQMHERDLENFRVLFFRVRDTHFNVTPQNVQMNETTFAGEDVFYRIGFQANEKKTGRNEEHWIQFA